MRVACDPEDVLVIREVSIDDAGAAAQLSGELGYPASTEVMEQRIRDLANRPDHTVYVACLEDMIVGWIDVGLAYHFQAEPYAEIGGLVVSSNARSNGIGRRLVAQAERWARERGVSRVVVRSRINREGAHRFYEREGYSRVKTSAVFSKIL
ncbi:MAG: GNAT family N-acetyltransferase [Acidobacteriaceae bacterium]|nr:GNAT family N-acetyltransferase [Acidobacteriaceae bacterium]